MLNRGHPRAALSLPLCLEWCMAISQTSDNLSQDIGTHCTHCHRKSTSRWHSNKCAL